jgi:hypothetical protein
MKTPTLQLPKANDKLFVVKSILNYEPSFKTQDYEFEADTTKTYKKFPSEPRN